MRSRSTIPDQPHRPYRRTGTTLSIGGSRCVRVLTLPEVCDRRILQRQWDASFGDELPDDLVVWLPWDKPAPPAPSAN